ncbi:MAG: NAD-dependent epimerase/dehydratase family protein [Candidatus Poseidoniia archaeon]|nr:NAD-dependent epimerase/dehydratase family protein [Candidatus Poseidoniia archaeon]
MGINIKQYICCIIMILVTGALGQIGTELVLALQEKYGKDKIIASDLKEPDNYNGKFVKCDIRDMETYEGINKENNVEIVYHLAAILSAAGERNPDLCYDVNYNGLENVLKIAKKYDQKLFCPSSIAVFGPDVPREKTPQNVALNPTTVYGSTKVKGEELCDRYFKEHGIDVRGIRYPGLISWKHKPSGGTTDYAVEMYFDAIESGKYECFVNKDTRLPMMFMEDAIRATLELMEAPLGSLNYHSNYNLSSMSFSAEELENEINSHVNFDCVYKPDYRQDIADTWPISINDEDARKDWGWQPKFDITKMTEEMITNLRRLNE